MATDGYGQMCLYLSLKHRENRPETNGGGGRYGGGPGSHYVAQASRLEIAHKHGGHMGLIITLIVFVGLAALIVWIADWTSGV
jgi:hypothetical protein